MLIFLISFFESGWSIPLRGILSIVELRGGLLALGLFYNVFHNYGQIGCFSVRFFAFSCSYVLFVIFFQSACTSFNIFLAWVLSVSFHLLALL